MNRREERIEKAREFMKKMMSPTPLLGKGRFMMELLNGNIADAGMAVKHLSYMLDEIEQLKKSGR